MSRKLSPEEVAALGLNEPAAQPRKLSPDEVSALGLDRPEGATTEAEPPGRLHSAVLGVAKGGTAGLVGKIGQWFGNAGDYEPVRLTPEAAAEAKRLGIPYEDNRLTVGELTRGGIEREWDAATDAHPGFAYGGEALGAIGLGVAGGGALKFAGLAPKAAATGLGRIGQTIAMQAPVGVGVAHLASDAKTGSGQYFWDLVKGGLTSAGAAGAGALLGEGVRALPAALKNVGINQGRRVLLNGADSLSTRAEVPPEVVEEAFNVGAIRPFSTTQKTLERLETAREAAGSHYSGIVEALEQRGVKGPVAKELADEILSKGAKLEPGEMNESVVSEYLNRAAQLEGKANESGILGLTQAESLKRSLQKQAKYGRWEETPLNEAKRDIASMVRQANENAIEKAGQAPEAIESGVQSLSGQFVPAKQKLGRLIEATDAAERGATRASQRSAISLQDKMMIAAGVASGNPTMAMASPVVTNLARNRGTSAIASAAHGLSKISTIKRLLQTNPAAFGRSAGVLTTAAQAGDHQLAAAHFAAFHNDPSYQANWKKLEADEREGQ